MKEIKKKNKSKKTKAEKKLKQWLQKEKTIKLELLLS